MASLQLAGMVSIAMLLTMASSVYAQELPKHISGHVVSGTAGIERVEVEDVDLRAFLNGVLVDSYSVAPDSDGRFIFRDVPPDDDLFYLLTTTYLNVLYQMDLAAEQDLSNVRLTVYESGASLEEITLKGWSAFILAADSGLQSLSILEVVTVVNTGDQVFVPDLTNAASMTFLRFPLAPRAANLEVESELPRGQVLQVDQGFAIMAPVPPGEHGIAFTYTIPYSGKELDLSRTFRLGSETFRIVIPEDLGSLAIGGLNDLGNMAIGESVYQIYGATGIGRDEEISVTLGDLPQPSAWQRIRGWLNPKAIGTVAIPITFSVALAALLLTKLTWRKPVRPASDQTTIKEDRFSMTESIAALDNQYMRGELPEEEYQQRRQEIKARLLWLVWQGEAL